MFLPGLKATVVRWLSGQFCITELDMDDNYYHVTKEAKQGERLGLYRAKLDKLKDHWLTRFVESGKIERQSNRLVAVADANYGTAREAASYSSDGMVEFLGKDTSSLHTIGCDLHFTPGQKPLGNLIRYNPACVDRSRASAILLAASMEGARNIKNVRWVADSGGSAILTQAMQILVDKNLSLDGHTVYFYKPKTSPAAALHLAHKLNLSVNEDFANTGYSLRSALSMLSVSGERIANENDKYDRGYHVRKWGKGVVAVSTPVGFAALLMGGPVAGIVGSIATAIGGVGAVYAFGESVAQGARRRYKL